MQASVFARLGIVVLSLLSPVAISSLDAQGIQLVAGSPIPIGGAQTRVAIVDINRDGIPDLVVAGSRLTTWIGLGDGRFVAGTDVTATGRTDFRVADFDRDGNADLITVDGRVFLGNGDGTFRAPHLPALLAAVGDPAIASIAVGDVNGDGCPDVIGVDNGFEVPYPAGTPAKVHVYPGKCDGTFGAVVTTVLLDDTEFVTDTAAGDFDGDGRADIVITICSIVKIYRGQADAHVVAGIGTGIAFPSICDSYAGGARLLVGDFDRDSKLDLAAASTFLPGMAIRLGNGDGTFRAAAAPVPPPPAAAYGLAAADLDGNGQADFVFVGHAAVAAHQIFVYPGIAAGFDPPLLLPTSTQPTNVAIGDLDGDGRPDVVVTTDGADVLVYLNRSPVVSFTAATATGTGMATAHISGGGPSCGFDNSATGFHATPANPAPPTGAKFPHGVLGFRLEGCVPGSTVVVDVTWPSLDPASHYLKLTRLPGGPATPIWYEPAGYSVIGMTTRFTLVDGGVGDDDLAANGVIVDPGGPALVAAALVTEVPTIGPVALALIILAILTSGAFALRRQARLR
jgi:hypothetical protein